MGLQTRREHRAVMDTCPYCGESECVCALRADEPLPDYDATLALLDDLLDDLRDEPTTYAMATLLGYRR